MSTTTSTTTGDGNGPPAVRATHGPITWIRSWQRNGVPLHGCPTFRAQPAPVG